MAAGWSACELIDTSAPTDSSLQPNELPRIGQTPLPVISNNEVSLTIPTSQRGDDVRFKSGDVPQPQVDTKALHQLLTQLTVTLDFPNVAVFAVLDSTGSQWEYGYTNLSFHEDVLEQANGNSRPFMFTRINEEGFMVVVTAMLPDTPSALLNFRRYLNVSTPQEVQSSQLRAKRSHPSANLQSTCANDGVLDCAILTWEDGHFDLMCWPQICVEAERFEHDWEGGGGGGSGGGFTEDNPCITDPLSCLPGGGSSVPSQPDCSGVLNGTAYWDPVCLGRCVGGNTDIIPASAGADCAKLNLPCVGDVVKNPEITSSSIDNPDNKTGGRFRPCVGASCPEELRAVRNGGARPHRGTDITCTEGDPIYAPFDMDGLQRGYTVDDEGIGYGYWVRGWTTIDGERLNFGVAHLQEGLRASGSIKTGDIIGYCGRSGITNRRVTTHAHLELGERVVFFSGTRDYLRNPELVLSTTFSQDSSAAPINENPCGQ